MPTLNQWRQIWDAHAVPPAKIPAKLYDELIESYSQTHRHYHTVQHLDECLDHFEMLRLGAEHPAEIEWALWFHDAIYEPSRFDNEERSADWAYASIIAAGFENACAQRVHKLIMATCHQALPASLDEQILLDCDLAILGANPERFAEYEGQIRAEYAFVPNAIFKAKRLEILQQFLARPAIFYTEEFNKRHEQQARINLIKSISLLET